MNRFLLPFVVIPCLLMASYGQAATLYQLDHFQYDTTTLDWSGYKESYTGPPQHKEGGPSGTGDYYLEQHTQGFHLATYNASQWRGDYPAAGIRAVEADINHLVGTDPVALRIAVIGPGGFFSSTTPTPITTGRWDHYVFGLTASDLVYVTGGSGSLADTLSAVDKLLFRHDIAASPTWPGFHPQHITATVGFDNIYATPEPATMTLMALAGLTVLRRRSRQAKTLLRRRRKQ